MKYRHLFFDLDRTLWDFDTTSRETLQEIQTNTPELSAVDFDSFLSNYHRINSHLWEEYREGIIDRKTLSLNRFHHTLQTFGINNVPLALKMAEQYVKRTSEKTLLFQDAREVLHYLHHRYQLHVLTNGFADVQYAKIKRSGIEKFFTRIITSEEAGHFKPSPAIFRLALEKTGALVSESLMIGDDPAVDLDSARELGMDQVYVNYSGIPGSGKYTYEVQELSALKIIL